jgi:hypothetical protein
VKPPRLLPLRCPGCDAALDVDAIDARLIGCPACPTAVDLAADGLHRYPVTGGKAKGGAKGLHWRLAGQLKVVTFAATAAAKTALGTLSEAGQVLPFTLDLPAAADTAVATYQAALARLDDPLVEAPWVATPAPAIATLGRREAERLARQVVMTLASKADGAIHRLDVALTFKTCAVVLVYARPPG